MPVVGFHQARRPRQTTGARLRRELSWPRPAGVLISLLGAALIFNGAVALADSTDASVVSVASSSPSLNTTPVTSQALVAPADPASTAPASAPSSATATATVSPDLAVSGVTAAPIAPVTTPPVLLVKGSVAGAPVQKLFAARTATAAAGDKTVLDVFNPKSTLVLVNKRNALKPLAHVPADLVTPAVAVGSGEPGLLRAEAASAAERMFGAAAAQGVSITLMSSYRSYDTQVSLYNGYAAEKGAEAADTTSAHPGFSEHQTGLAIDIGDGKAGNACDFRSCFAETAAAQWVAAHGADYGFLVRYLTGSEAVTGYWAEPWHLRYVGVEVAQDVVALGIPTYEEYLGLPGAPGYK